MQIKIGRWSEKAASMTEELITGTSGVVRKRSKMEADEWE